MLHTTTSNEIKLLLLLLSRSVMSDSEQPHGLQPSRLLHPWDFPGKSTGVGCHCRLWNKTEASYFLIAQSGKNLPAIQETWVWFLGREDPLEKEMATHSSILAWRILWIEEPGMLQSMGVTRVRHNLATKPPPVKFICQDRKKKTKCLSQWFTHSTYAIHICWCELRVWPFFPAGSS